MLTNSRFILWMFVAIIAVWLAIMTISRNAFLHYNVDALVVGETLIKNTDIGNQCGILNDNELVDYKLTRNGKIIYLCPLSWWPIQKRVVAETLPDNFRKTLPPAFLSKVSVYYPEPQKIEPLIPLPTAP